MVTYSLICVLCFCLVASLCFWYFRCFLVLLELFAVFVRVKSFCKKKKKRVYNCPNNLIYITTIHSHNQNIKQDDYAETGDVSIVKRFNNVSIV